MTSITTFAYGLTVEATGLITAAHAWPSLEPTFDFFDLLFLRKRKGTLQGRSSGSEGQGIIASVPVEVWEEIRKWVVMIEMETAEDEMLRDFRDPDFDCVEECDCCPRRKITLDLIAEEVAAGMLYHLYFEFVNGFVEGLGSSMEVRSNSYFSSLC